MNENLSVPQIHFIFGNQTFEIEAETKKIADTIVTKEEQSHSLFSFRTSDFFDQDRSKSSKVIGNFQSSCEIVSFFSSNTVIVLNDIQAIPSRKSPAAGIEKSLKGINLVKMAPDIDADWFDADSLTEQLETHHHITGRHIVREIECYANQTYFLDLVPEYRHRLVYRKKGKGQEAVEIAEFFKSKIKKRLLFERPVDDLPTPFASGSKAIDVIKRCIESPPRTVYLIVTANIKKMGEVNREVADLLQKKARVVQKTIANDSFRPLSWVMTQAQGKNLMMNAPTADLLMEVAGTDLAVLNMELDKLSILLPAGSTITPELLIKNICHSKRFTIFRAAEFLLKKDLRRALECVEQIVGENVSSVVSLFSLIVSQFRRVLKMAWLLEAGFEERRIAGKMKLHPWVAKQSIGHLRNFTTQELENIVVHLAKLDLQVKYAAKDAPIILENACFQICQGSFASKDYLDRSWCP